MMSSRLFNTLRHRRSTVVITQIAALSFFISHAKAGNTWDGTGGDNNWTTNANWNFDTAPGYGTLVFSGTTRTTNVINANYSMNQVNWNGSSAWTLNNSGGSVLSLFDNGGVQAKLESLGTGGVTINAPVTFAATAGANWAEINAVSSNITFGSGTLNVSGSAVSGVRMFGGNGLGVTFQNTVTALGKYFAFTNTNTQSATIAAGANVTSNDWHVMNNATLNLAGGSLTTTAVRLGGDFGTTGSQNQTLGATLALTPAAGGVSFGSTINAVSGNTSGNLRIDSQNTSGTNNITSGVFLDSDLQILQAAGGTLAFSSGTFDVKSRQLVVNSSGSVSIGQTLASSNAAGGTLVKQGSGTLTLSGTTNTYTGTNNTTLNANGTQIAAGTLAIAADTSLGVAPAGAYNNVQFTGSGTLRANASISLNANRNVSIASGSTGTFDNNGNTFTINGIVNGTGGNVASTGTGTTILTAASTYTGTTTVSAGTLQIGNGGSTGSLGTGAVTNNATLAFNRNNSMTVANNISGTGNVTQSGSGTTTLSGTNTYAGTTTISAGTLELGGSSTALGTGPVVNNATLAFNQSAGQTIANSISGTGGITQSGAAIILTGANSYSGTTTINSSTLQVGAGGTAGSLGTGNVTNNGYLRFNRSDNISVGNAISGTGELYQDGGGSTTLTAGNSYSGLTFINSGTLQVGNGGSTGNLGGGTVVNNAALTFNRNDTMTVANIINGSGSVTQSGSGTTVLSGSNGYSGGTTISAGTLQLNGVGSLGTGPVTNNGALVYNLSTPWNVMYAISGSGSLTHSGSQTLSLSGANSYTGTTTITTGKLEVGNVGTTGSLGTGAVTNNGELWFIRTDGHTVGNDISGSGSVTNGAGGTTTLTGTNTYSGTTTILSGTLQIGNGGSTGSLGTGAVTNNATLAFNRASGSNFVLANAISGTGVLQQNGGNIITIGSANTYSGTTTINSGILRVTANDALGTSAGGTVVNSGGQLRLFGVSYTTAEALTINGTGGDGNGALYSLSGTNSYAGLITAASNSTIKNNGTSLDLNGGLVKNGTTLTLSGTGVININNTGISGAAANSDLIVDTATVVVNAASNYNGPTTVQNNGVLVANAAIDTTQLTVDSGSTLAGSASINAGAGNVYLNGTFVAGSAGGGAPREDFAITAASTIAGNNSTLKFDLFQRGNDLTGTASAADTLLVTGGLSLLSNVVLDIANAAGLSGWAAGDKWNLWDVSGTTTGTIATINAPALGNPLLGWQFTESSGVLEIIAVPEPSRALLMMLGVAGLGIRRRRRA